MARRLRRRRQTPAIRAMLRETRLTPSDFIYPIFVADAPKDAGPVSSMPGVVRYDVDRLEGLVERIQSARIPAVMLFGIPAKKDAEGTQAWAEDGVVSRALRRLKSLAPRLTLIADVCLCEYTSHGHCGHVHGERIENDSTLDALQRASITYAAAGADIVAPSGMMDGMVAAIRAALDENKHVDTGILSYSVKYASSFYGPFRDAADCAPQFGDRRSHQMDPANAREALAEAEQDITEGADAIMVKPALSYLDVIARLRRNFESTPIAAYQVSGEYSMIKAAAASGWIDEKNVALESLLSIKRAGADTIITYYALEAAKWLAEGLANDEY
ncbi:MAG: porphobilinogen synthase [Phycisphaerales bacterium]|nr:porphobilinogen synthase [Phycisphaerales bacterium]MCB9862411.1 porphobilinogen synthase [Phycisphaerales bacterium]